MPCGVRELFVLIALLCAPLACVTTARGQSVEEDETETLQAINAPQDADQVDAAKTAELIVTKTNAFREAQELSPVATSEELNATAQGFAQFMARTDRYGHRADGNRPSQRAANHGYEYCLVAENIAYQFSSAGFETAELAVKFVEGWKDSPEHREAMLEPAVRETGVSVARSDKTGHWYAVQMFGRPKSAAIEFRIANESETEVSYTIRSKTFRLPAGYVRVHTRCRKSPVQFELPQADGEAQTQVEPQAGDRYTIERVNKELRVQQDSP